MTKKTRLLNRCVIVFSSLKGSPIFGIDNKMVFKFLTQAMRCKIRGGRASPLFASWREVKMMKNWIPIDAQVSEIIQASALAWQMCEEFHKDSNNGF